MKYQEIFYLFLFFISVAHSPLCVGGAIETGGGYNHDTARPNSAGGGFGSADFLDLIELESRKRARASTPAEVKPSSTGERAWIEGRNNFNDNQVSSGEPKLIVSGQLAATIEHSRIFNFLMIEDNCAKFELSTLNQDLDQSNLVLNLFKAGEDLLAIAGTMGITSSTHIIPLGKGNYMVQIRSSTAPANRYQLKVSAQNCDD